MNRSIVLVAVTAALAACTSTPTPDNNATSTPTGTSTSTPQATVVTEVVTQTVTNPPVKPVIDSFGYGGLKLGMTLQQALDTKLIGPARREHLLLGGHDGRRCWRGWHRGRSQSEVHQPHAATHEHQLGPPGRPRTLPPGSTSPRRTASSSKPC